MNKLEAKEKLFDEMVEFITSLNEIGVKGEYDYDEWGDWITKTSSSLLEKAGELMSEAKKRKQ